MSFTDAIDDFKNRENFQITRRAAGSYTDGVWAPGATSTFLIDALIVPVTGRKLMQLSEAYHTQDIKEIFTKTELRPQDKSTGEGDSFIDGGKTYTVVASNDWEAFDEFFWHAIAISEPV